MEKITIAHQYILDNFPELEYNDREKKEYTPWWTSYFISKKNTNTLYKSITIARTIITILTAWEEHPPNQQVLDSFKEDINECFDVGSVHIDGIDLNVLSFDIDPELIIKFSELLYKFGSKNICPLNEKHIEVCKKYNIKLCGEDKIYYALLYALDIFPDLIERYKIDREGTLVSDWFSCEYSDEETNIKIMENWYKNPPPQVVLDSFYEMISYSVEDYIQSIMDGAKINERFFRLIIYFSRYDVRTSSIYGYISLGLFFSKMITEQEYDKINKKSIEDIKILEEGEGYIVWDDWNCGY